MRHRKKGKKLNRNIKRRQALFKDLIKNLIIHEQINTTEAKAKAIKGIMDKLMTQAKAGSLSARRQVLAFITDKKVVHKLFDELAPRTKKRVSGFTKMIRTGQRRGDNTMMAKIEFVDSKSNGSELRRSSEPKTVKSKTKKQSKPKKK